LFEGNIIMNAHSQQGYAQPTLEEQLVQVISRSRQLAAISEELLREVAARNLAVIPNPTAQHAANFAPIMLASASDQLTTIIEMLRQADA
jgi:hypothetical protein